MNDEQTPINPQSTRRRGPLTVLVDLGLGFQERVLWRIGDGLRALPGAVLRPFEWIGWTVRRALIWPLADRLALLSGPGRALAIAASPLVVVAIAAGVSFATSSGTTGNPAAEPAAVVSAAPVARASAAPQPKPAEPTLHGAPPSSPRPGQGGERPGSEGARALRRGQGLELRHERPLSLLGGNRQDLLAPGRARLRRRRSLGDPRPPGRRQGAGGGASVLRRLRRLRDRGQELRSPQDLRRHHDPGAGQGSAETPAAPAGRRQRPPGQSPATSSPAPRAAASTPSPSPCSGSA